ncbi:MAG: MBOAT family O-acyltransferase [bacterium]|nr:MBOAT family O-acyltransferase [bacterium]
MLFSSPVFLLFFLPLFLLLYFLLGRKLRNILLLVASLFFYTWGEGKLVAIMLTSTVVDYFAAMVMSHGFNFKKPIEQLNNEIRKTWLQKGALVFSIVVNLSLLGFFKYFNFGLDNFNALIEVFGFAKVQLGSTWQIILPLGISFYTFQSMSYTIDVYRGLVPATRNFLNFASFVTMFPQLVAGPIVRYADISKQLVNRVVTRPLFASGIRRFIVGFGKKMLIANQVAIPADAIFAIPANELTISLAWFGVICYSLQIYFDFSAYSDMAIGLGRMLGFKFLENFNYPYIAKSIQDFWRRWHISLSTWFRDYLYIPLGGNRKSSGRTYVNLVIVFLITGLWHGASWNFIIWGLFHGLFLIIERLGWSNILKRIWVPFRFIYMILVVMIGWVFFRTDDLHHAWNYLVSMFGFNNGAGIEYHLSLFINPILLISFIAGLIGAVRFIPFIREYMERKFSKMTLKRSNILEISLTIILLMLLILILVLSIMQLANNTYNPFIYFRF